MELELRMISVVSLTENYFKQLNTTLVQCDTKIMSFPYKSTLKILFYTIVSPEE